MVTLYFTRKFNKGTLAGLIHHDKLPFVSYERAQEWLKGVKKYAKRNGYGVIDASFQNYVR